MDKNLSMLVCLHTDNKADLKELHKIYLRLKKIHIFKSMFFFSKEQEKTLTELFEREEGENSKFIINKIVNDNENFVSFKRNPDILSDSEYGICSRLLIKLPFIVFEREEKDCRFIKNNRRFANGKHRKRDPRMVENRN